MPEQVVYDLWGDLDRGPYSIDEMDGPASAVVDLTGRLARFRALDRVQERIDAGKIKSATSADTVRDARTAAYDALEAALAESPDADLARTVLNDVSWQVYHADRDLSRTRGRGEVTPSSLDDVMKRYIVTTAVARATPDACQQTVDALNTA
ncbi:hypothetical protein VB773_20970 [Haloarculaceae archaeon H-GB2-1]|nr:hypothetical protein [Haloarculaceae archaeon H-GB11]MEA5409795.1 hypothetical protein [Haloarculaceae archaeon H-GB2-1]